MIVMQCKTLLHCLQAVIMVSSTPHLECKFNAFEIMSDGLMVS